MARLGELERKVMDILWAEGPEEATVREVAAALPDYAYTTVLTVLDRLHRKGLVARSRDGRAFRYVALTSREEHAAALMREVLGTTNDRDAVLVRFAESVSPDEAAVLAQALGEVAQRIEGTGDPATSKPKATPLC